MLGGIARNILTAGVGAQDLAASRDIRVEEAMFSVLNLCVRVTGRGFDSGGTKEDERKWQGVVNDFKRLLATTLQVLNNLVVQNERRKLMLWVGLFDSPPEGDVTGGSLDRRLIDGLRDDPVVNGTWTQQSYTKGEVGHDGVPNVIRRFQDGLLAHMHRLEDRRLAARLPYTERLPGPGEKDHLTSSPFLLYIGKVGMDIKRELTERDFPAGATEIAAECKRRWQAMSRDEQRSWHEYYTQLLNTYRSEVEARDAAAEGVADVLTTINAVKAGTTFSDDTRAEIEGLAQSVDTVVQLQEELKALQIKGATFHRAEDGVYEVDLPADQEEMAHRTFAALQHTSQLLYPEVMANAAHPRPPDRPAIQPRYPQQYSESHTSHLSFGRGNSGDQPATAEDYAPTYSSAYGAAILQQGKEDLLRRLEPDRAARRRARTRSPPPPPPSATSADAAAQSRSASQPDGPDAPLCLASDDGLTNAQERDRDLSEEEDSEYDDPVPGDDGRGLLTDVPLILGPTEIEVLPMIVQSGIVPPSEGQPGYGATPEEREALKSMHTLRCHLLLAQDNGRNLVRELLIFVAAWDLREEELYFQLMTQIMEAILVNGLLPFAYHAFRESKDIISPAQAVIMKLLTHIFRRRQTSTAKRGLAIFPRTTTSPPPAENGKAREGKEKECYPMKVDVHMVSFLLTEFRRHIIPQTCALIFLQGQIRQGLVSPEEFPLNLWDMERMYEGVYQYLEFFAILTEHEAWKNMMGDWEVVDELVTLLEELERGVPRGTARMAQKNRRAQGQPQPNYQYAPPPATTGATDAGGQYENQQPAPVAVERPYDPQAPQPAPTDPTQPTPQMPPPPPIEDEPSDFEWRNLKKLAVLVLSSLVWKSRKVQEQLGSAGPVPNDGDGEKGRGIRALLNCCKVDDYNPYIREHAIMALRFALEGNEANQDVVRRLEAQGMDPANPPTGGLDMTGGAATLRQEEGRVGVISATGVRVEVPREVLDLNGYETFVDVRGQVQLKKKYNGHGGSSLSNVDDFGQQSGPMGTRIDQDLPIRGGRLAPLVSRESKEMEDELLRREREGEGNMGLDDGEFM
jgi:hypothetical protein